MLDDLKTRYEKSAFGKDEYSAEKEIYSKIVGAIEEIYDKITDGGKILPFTKDKVLSDYDEYLQSAIVKISYNNGKPDVKCLRAADEVVKYGKLVDGGELSVIASSFGAAEKLSETAEKRLCVAPLCAKIAAAIDAGKNFGLTEFIYKNTYSLLSEISIKTAVIKDGYDISGILTAIKETAEKRGIKIND